MNSQVLVLNASYEPIHVCGVKRAIVLIVKGVACSEQNTSHVMRSPSTVMPVPAVIRLVHFINLPYRKKAYSKKHIICGTTLPASIAADRRYPAN